MLVYCDSSALLKRSLQEPESDALEAHLTRCVEDGHLLVSSALAWIEVNRAIRLRRDSLGPKVWIRFERTALSGIDQLPLDATTMSLARRVGSPGLRSLDAIHLAAAVAADVGELVTYDHRLAEVANEMGIETSSPK
ncbi:MAG TPA: type II toxin-antitoxin system VapC family toxin [Galbitalea sp.]|nr:type II toxin-antitoxin system VapC family toxin [Galbitalea sp.]